MDTLLNDTQAMNIQKIIEKERARIHLENKRRNKEKCMRYAGLTMVMIFGLVLAAVVGMLSLDLFGFRNGLDCKVNYAFQSANFSRSLLEGWVPECLECNTEIQVLDSNKRNCLSECPDGEGPRMSHISKDHIVKVCESCLYSSGRNCKRCEDGMCIEANEGYFIVNETIMDPETKTQIGFMTRVKQCHKSIAGCKICDQYATKCLACFNNSHYLSHHKCRKKCQYWQRYLPQSDECESCRPYYGQSKVDDTKCKWERCVDKREFKAVLGGNCTKCPPYKIAND